jgi:hypothetical protein
MLGEIFVSPVLNYLATVLPVALWTLLAIFIMSSSTLLILAIVAMPAYFFVRWLIKPGPLTRTERTVAYVAGVATLAIGSYVLLGLGYLHYITRVPTRDFDRARWEADKDKRYEMRDDLEDVIRPGQTKAEVSALLGTPEGARQLNGDGQLERWMYDLGTAGVGFGVRFYFFYIEFEGEKVKTAHVSHADD